MPFLTSEERNRWLTRYLDLYNLRRCHMALGGISPKQRLQLQLAECSGEKVQPGLATTTLMSISSFQKFLTLLAFLIIYPVAPHLWHIPHDAHAQTTSRSSFPGRRVGGGTRGDCSARQIVHLAPLSGSYAPGRPGLLGLLEGPADDHRPLEIEFRLHSSGSLIAKRVLAAGGPALVLLPSPAVVEPVVWESMYRCDAQIRVDNGQESLHFNETTFPPARSLLVLDSAPADAAIQTQLRQLLERCGANISRKDLVASFGLSDLLDTSWPDHLSVRCPS